MTMHSALYSNHTMTAIHPPVAGSTNDHAGASGPSGVLPRSRRGVDPAGGPRRVRVGIIGATGYVGAELIRLLARHPNVDLVGLAGRGRDHDPIAGIHPHLGTTGMTVHAELPPADAVFLALPQGAAPAIVPDLVAAGPQSSIRALTSACANPRTTRAGTASSTLDATCSSSPSTASPSSTGRSLRPWWMRLWQSSGLRAATRRRPSWRLRPSLAPD